MATLRFQCPECGMGDFGCVADGAEVYCIVCRKRPVA